MKNVCVSQLSDAKTHNDSNKSRYNYLKFPHNKSVYSSSFPLLVEVLNKLQRLYREQQKILRMCTDKIK